MSAFESPRPEERKEKTEALGRSFLKEVKNFVAALPDKFPEYKRVERKGKMLLTFFSILLVLGKPGEASGEENTYSAIASLVEPSASVLEKVVPEDQNLNDINLAEIGAQLKGYQIIFPDGRKAAFTLRLEETDSKTTKDTEGAIPFHGSRLEKGARLGSALVGGTLYYLSRESETLKKDEQFTHESIARYETKMSYLLRDGETEKLGIKFQGVGVGATREDAVISAMDGIARQVLTHVESAENANQNESAENGTVLVTRLSLSGSAAVLCDMEVVSLNRINNGMGGELFEAVVSAEGGRLIPPPVASN